MLPENPNGEILMKGKFLNIWSSPSQPILAIEEQKNNAYRLSFYLPQEQAFLANGQNPTELLLNSPNVISNVIWGNDSLSFQSGNKLITAYFDLANKTVTASYSSFPANDKDKTITERITTKSDEKIWWNSATNEIFVDWLKDKTEIPYYICENKETCQLPLLLLKSQFPIKNIDFFPGRKDVIIIAVGNGVYALEIDGRSGRLLYPIYKGKEPTFAVLNGEENVYVLDGESLIKISLK